MGAIMSAAHGSLEEESSDLEDVRIALKKSRERRIERPVCKGSVSQQHPSVIRSSRCAERSRAREASRELNAIRMFSNPAKSPRLTEVRPNVSRKAASIALFQALVLLAELHGLLGNLPEADSAESFEKRGKLFRPRRQALTEVSQGHKAGSLLPPQFGCARRRHAIAGCRNRSV